MVSIKKISEQFKAELSNHYEPSELNQMLRIIMEQEFDIPSIEILTNHQLGLSAEQIERLSEIKSELKRYKPLAHILGQWVFYDLPVNVNEHTLIPRPETEELVQLILDENGESSLTVVDIGTGSGCIALALKKNRSEWSVHGFDVSHKALKVAVKNGLQNQLEVQWEEFDVLKGRNLKYDNSFDIIVSNPPYIPIKEKSQMDTSVVDFEPELALFVPDEDALQFYEAILDFAKVNLKNQGKVYFETHHLLATSVVDLLASKGFEAVEVFSDINGKNRMVRGRLVN